MQQLGTGLLVKALLTAVLAALAPAAAQIRNPSISCAVNDSNLHLDLFLPLNPDGSGTGAKAGMQGVLEIHHFKMPKERRRWQLDGRQPTQMWTVGNDLRLRLMPATGENLIDLVIETQRRPTDATHSGAFRLETAEGVSVQGRIACTSG